MMIALIKLSQFVIDRTGSRPQYEHLVSIVNAAFPALGKISSATARKRLEKIPPEPWIEIPPLHKLGGDRQDRRLWVLTLMHQARRDILSQELDKLREPSRRKREKENAERLAAQDEQQQRQQEQEARQAWETFWNFARRTLTSGQQKRIEPIIKAVGGWNIVCKRWRSWDDAKAVWIPLWAANRFAWEAIIRSLS